MKVIIPMSGQGVRFRNAGYKELKPLIPVFGQPMISYLLNCFPKDWTVEFICDEDHEKNHDISNKLNSLRPGCKIHFIPSHKQGPVGALLKAADTGFKFDDEPVLISYCDYSMSFDGHQFEKFTKDTDADGVVITYTGFHPQYIRPTMYAYCQHSEDTVTDIKEKGCFTENRENEPASSGGYYFKSAKKMIQWMKNQWESKDLINGEGYVSLTYNQLFKENAHVKLFNIDHFLQWGTPDDLKDFEYWANTIAHTKTFKKTKSTTPPGAQLLVPMAGRGERFGTGKPKPLRTVLNKPLYQMSIEFFPQADTETLVIRNSFKDEVEKLSPTSRCISIQEVTEGQAITTQLGAKELNQDKPVLVTACDHGLIWDHKKWTNLIELNPDVIVFGQKNYPETTVTPNSFSYITTHSQSTEIKRAYIKEPAEKNDPRDGIVLVGSFYFKSTHLMNSLIDDLVNNNDRVNNEFYLDSVVNIAISKGLSCHCFETQAYLCWGTPSALNTFNYWNSYFENNSGVFDVKV